MKTVLWAAVLLVLLCLPAQALAEVDCMPDEPVYTPEMPQYHDQLGGSHYSHKDYEAAISAYEQAIALDASYMHGYYGLAMTYRAMGRLDLAIEHYGKCILLTPEYASPYLARAEIHQFLRRDAEALADLNRYVEVYGQYPDAYTERGDFFLTTKAYQQAIDDYTAALERKPAPAARTELCLKRAGAWLSLGEAARAESDFRSACSIGEQ